MVPHLVTALAGPINELEQRILDSMPAIERWFRLEWMEHTPTFYSAVDVRNAGFKLSPVDTQLFPAGWGSLSEGMVPLAVQAAMAAIEKICPEARNLLIIPDNTNRSNFYLSSLAQLRRIFHMAGLHVRIGSISPDVKKPLTIALDDGESITLEPVVRNKGRLSVKDFDPCTILLNNDLGTGVPGILEDLHGQYLLPPLHAGWPTRRRSVHFRCYEELAKRFGKLIGVDPWLIYSQFEACPAANLSTPAGVEALGNAVETLLARVRKKHKEYGIKAKPFVVITSDDGSPAAANWAVHDAKEVAALCADMPNSVRDWVVLEGVLTQERINDTVAEPVVYLMDRYVVGGFYRVQAAGSHFIPLAFAENVQVPQPGVKPGASAPNRFYMYGVVGRLAMLAASYQLEATDPDAENYA